jgi:D-aspartate ligase
MTRSSQRPDTSRPVCVLKLGAQGALGLVRSLGRLGVPVFGVHDGARAPALRSRYLRRVLPLDIDDTPAAEAVPRLLDFGATIGGRPLLLTTDDVGALFVEDNAAALRERFEFPAQPHGLAHELYSKRGMYLLCKRLDVPTPETEFPQSLADVERFLESDPRFPIVLKPIDSWQLHRSGQKMLIAQGSDQLLAGYERLEDPAAPNLMLQEYIPGGPDSVWMFNGYFDADARCLAAFTGRKLRQYPPYTGMTSLGVCIRNEEVERATIDLMGRIGYRGVVDIGWRYDERDGRYKLLDVNPRLGNTFRLFVAPNGLDVARCLYLDLTGQPVPELEFPEGRKWLVEDFDVAGSLVYLRDGKLTPRAWARQLRGVEEAAWWARDDPLPFLSMSAAGGGKVLRRLRRSLGR